MLKDFKAFITRGNVVDLAVGIIIGAAFGAIIGSLVNDMIMPPIGLALGKADFANMYVVLKEGATAGPYESLAAAKAAGAVSMNYGVFINTIINFLIVGFCVFLVVKAYQKMTIKPVPAAAPAAPTTKECPFCATSIPIKAQRCPNCTSPLSKGM